MAVDVALDGLTVEDFDAAAQDAFIGVVAFALASAVAPSLSLGFRFGSGLGLGLGFRLWCWCGSGGLRRVVLDDFARWLKVSPAFFVYAVTVFRQTLVAKLAVP